MGRLSKVTPTGMFFPGGSTGRAAGQVAHNDPESCMRAVVPALSLLTLLGVNTLEGQEPRPGTAVARISATATVVPVAPAQQSARLIQATLDRPLPEGRSTRRDGLSWVTVERPRKSPRRITVNYLAN